MTDNNVAPKFLIDKCVAIPAMKRPNLYGTKPAIYPWAHMQPGDSFFVPGGKISAKDKRPGTTVQLSIAGPQKKYPGTKWATRSVTENNVNGLRVWRLK
jgi:hypothetical protein